ncbi:hypothetical protein Hanom_Chr12g01154951 [Helianthus anomalus]
MEATARQVTVNAILSLCLFSICNPSEFRISSRLMTMAAWWYEEIGTRKKIVKWRSVGYTSQWAQVLAGLLGF